MMIPQKEQKREFCIAAFIWCAAHLWAYGVVLQRRITIYPIAACRFVRVQSTPQNGTFVTLAISLKVYG
jgi:hypothetical protein